jgi:hypothetical protein
MSPWLAVALGAGVFSAVVNVTCNVVARRRNSTRSAAERVHAGRHTALAAAITLEEFAHRCQVTIDRAERRDLSEQRHVQMGDIEIPPFAFSNDIQWRDLDAGKASYLRAFSADQTHNAERIQSNDRCPDVDEFAAYIKGHCAEFGRRAWLMAVELREENELGAVADHDYLIEFDAALSRYTAWERRQKVRKNESVPTLSHVTQSPHRSGNRARGLVMGGPA